ncbi:MAG: family 16 glycosylhydrolase, partial [Acidobacteriaceae bacterium]
GCTLLASSSNLTSATSTSFTISAASDPAAKLAFSQQPSNAIAGATITPAVKVAVEDANGNILTSATDQVTLSLAGGSGLQGTLTATAQNGIATFSTLSVSTAGTGLTIVAADSNLTSATSSSFTISAAAATTVTVTPTTASVKDGATQQFSASVTGVSNTAVTWTVSGSGCSGTACGAISSSGLYTAPTVQPASANVTVTATSVSDSTKTATATISLVPPQASNYQLVWEDTFSTLNMCNTNVPGCNWYNPGVWLWGTWSTVTDPDSTYVNLDWSSTNTSWDWPSIGTASPNAEYYHAWKYGYFEVSMAFNPATGSWPAIWLLPLSMNTNPKQTSGLNTGGEIDMFEWQSYMPNMFAGTVHVWNNGADVANNEGTNFINLPAGTDLSQFNKYGLLWTPTSLSWYFNDVLMETVDTTQSAYNTTFNNSGLFYLILDQANGCNWNNNPCAGQASPLDMKVQWVHVYQTPQM